MKISRLLLSVGAAGRGMSFSSQLRVPELGSAIHCESCRVPVISQSIVLAALHLN